MVNGVNISGPCSKKTKKLLLVEDESLIALIEKRQLEQRGYDVHHFLNGEDAVQYVTEKPDQADLILMDIDLGEGMDGTQTAEKILKKYDIPILFLSSHTEKEVVEKTEKISSYGYVVKNSNITVLDASIKMAFKLYEAKQKEALQNQKLKDSELRYRQMFENHSAVELIMHPETGKIVDANQQAVKFYGYIKEELLQKSIFEINTSSIDKIKEQIKQVKNNQRSFFEFQHRLANGSLRNVNVFTSKMNIGKEIFLHSIVFDVTNHIHNLENTIKKLEESRQIYKTTLENLPIGLAVNKISDKEIILTNQNFHKIYQTEKESFTNFDDFFDAVYKSESFRHQIKARILEDLDSGNPERMKWENVPLYVPEKDENAYISAQNIPLFEHDLMISTVIDVTDVNQAKNKALYWHGFFNYVLRYNKHPIAVFDTQMKYIFVSDSYIDAFDLSGNEILGKSHYEIFPEIPEKFKISHQKALKGEVVSSNQDFFIRKNGTILFTSWICRPWLDIKGKVGGVILYTDVIAKKSAKQKLDYETNSPSKLILNTLNDFIVTLDKAGVITGLYGKGLEKLEISIHDCLGKKFDEILLGKPKKIHLNKIKEALSGHETTYEWTYKIKKEKLHFLTTFYPYTDADSQVQILIGFSQDITSLKKANEKIKSELNKKDLLLKELYHRINNNLMGIKGILDLKLNDKPGQETVKVIKDLQGRLDNMQLIYKKLAVSDNTKIDSANYIEELTYTIINTRNQTDIQTKHQLEKHFIEGKKMYAVGIIINEIITNALKYAFVQNPKEIELVFYKKNTHFVLEVADNGIGLPKKINTSQNNCLGLTLVGMLTDQLRGSCQIIRQNGTRFRILFPVD